MWDQVEHIPRTWEGFVLLSKTSFILTLVAEAASRTGIKMFTNSLCTSWFRVVITSQSKHMHNSRPENFCLAFHGRSDYGCCMCSATLTQQPMESIMQPQTAAQCPLLPYISNDACCKQLLMQMIHAADARSDEHGNGCKVGE